MRMIRWTQGRLVARQGGTGGSRASPLSTLLIRRWQWEVHDCGAEGGGGNNIFSVVLSEAQTVATITVPVMFPSIPFGGILAAMVFLSPTVPPTIHLC